MLFYISATPWIFLSDIYRPFFWLSTHHIPLPLCCPSLALSKKKHAAFEKRKGV